MTTLRRNTPDLLLLLAILTLLGLGLIMVASSSTVAGLTRIKDHPDAFHFIKRQVVYAFVGLIGMVLLMNFDYHRLRRFSVPLVVVTPILLGLVLLMGEKTLGAKRWIDLGFLNLQPSEFAKLALVMVLAHYLSDLGEGVGRFTAGIMLPLLFTAILAGLIMAEPDMGTTLVLCGTCFCLIFAAGARVWQMGLLSGPVLLILIIYALGAPYRRRRLFNFLDPFKDPQGAGYQVIQSLYALGSGGPFGVGIGRSRQKFSYLPEAHTDYIFSIIGEELGLVGTLFVLTLFFFLIWRGLRTALAAKDTYGTLLAVGITSLIGVQAILNIGVVTASLPVTGITLPLLSSGGSSLMVTLVGLGILLNISRQSN